MKTWKYNFLNVEDAIEITKYNLTPQEISETLTSGVVLVGVEEVKDDGVVFRYVIEYEDGDGECVANGFVCAVNTEMARDAVLKAYTLDTDYLIFSVDIFENRTSGGVKMNLDLGDVIEMGTN